MSGTSLERGRGAEQRIAHDLTRWTDSVYRFTRRGLGHKGLPDLVVRTREHGRPAWPFPISVKSDIRHAPGLHGLCALAWARSEVRAAVPAHYTLTSRFKQAGWAWWQEIPEPEQGQYWLVWRAHGMWWLSADGGNAVWRGDWPAVLRLSGPGRDVPTMTAPFAHLLARDFPMAWESWR